MWSGSQDTGRGILAALGQTVRQLPSIMARLIFLSGLRDPHSGVYRHPAATRHPEKTEIDRLLRGLHKQAFAEWLNSCLEEQKADLDLCFSDLSGGKVAAVETWRCLESYRSLVPSSADPVERRLFFADMAALLELMANELRLATGSSDEAEPCAPNEALLTAKKLSKWLGISDRTVRLWAETREIPAVKVGRQWRFRRGDISEWLRKRRGGG